MKITVTVKIVTERVDNGASAKDYSTSMTDIYQQGDITTKDPFDKQIQINQLKRKVLYEFIHILDTQLLT